MGRPGIRPVGEPASVLATTGAKQSQGVVHDSRGGSGARGPARTRRVVGTEGLRGSRRQRRGPGSRSARAQRTAGAVEAFRALGLSEAAAETAAKGRR